MHEINLLQLFGEENAPAAAETPADTGPPADARPDDAPESADPTETPESAQQPTREELYRNLRNAALRQRFAAWHRQAEEAKQEFPGLDMAEAARNPRFRELLWNNGLDVASAYLLTHRQQEMERIARDVEQRIAGRMMSASTRPPENGAPGGAGGLSRYDVASMSRKDREAIRRRAARGERIRF